MAASAAERRLLAQRRAEVRRRQRPRASSMPAAVERVPPTRQLGRVAPAMSRSRALSVPLSGQVEPVETGDLIWTRAGVGLGAAGWGTEQPSGGSSSFPENWCYLTLTQSAPLTAAGESFYDFVEGDYTIIAQSGSDFSIGTDATMGDGCVISAVGGAFQSALLVKTNAGAFTFDAATDAVRWVQAGLSMGPMTGPVFNVTGIGIDVRLPVQPPDAPSLQVASVSTIGYIAPGASILAGAFLNLANGVGDDSIQLVTPLLAIWQVGTLT